MTTRPRTWSDPWGGRVFRWGRLYLHARTRAVSVWVALAVVIAVVSGCSGGGSTPIPSSQVCVSAFGHIRVDDFRCGGASMAYDWWYLAPGALAPTIGQHATVGSLTRPSGRVRSGLPATPTRTTTTTKRPTTATKKPTTKRTAKPAAPKPKPAAPKARTR